MEPVGTERFPQHLGLHLSLERSGAPGCRDGWEQGSASRPKLKGKNYSHTSIPR